jgi:hypothetical protein
MASKKPDAMSRRVVARFKLEAMSNLPPEDTGVTGAVIWVSSGEFAGTAIQHGPRVKVIRGTKITPEGLEDSVSVTLTNPPQVIGTLPGRLKRQVVAFVDANRDILLRYWRSEISTRVMLEGLTRL